MSASDEDRPSGLEQHARQVLDDSVSRVNGRVRSRLIMARQAALAELHANEGSGGGGLFPWRAWRLPALPATGAVLAVALLAVVLFTQPVRERALPLVEGGATYEDLELLSDNDGLELIENFDGSFYEWAAAQAEVADGGASG